MIKKYVVSVMFFAVGLLTFSQDNAIQAAVDSPDKPINTPVVQQLKHSNKNVKNSSANMDVFGGSNIVIVTCTDVDGKSQNFKIQGMAENTVVVNCETDTNGDAHITVKGDGASREIGVVKIQGNAENVFIVNTHQLGRESKIVVEGKNAKASVGDVEVKGNKLNNAEIINSTVINGGMIEAKGDGASVSVGTVIIGN